jgi:hypothetical protein
MAMNRTTCLITGCALYLQHSRDFAWGDLHMQGDRFIFNGCTSRDGRMDWLHKAPPNPERALCIPVGEEYFERRGVLVCRASRSLLNAVALAYLDGSPHSREMAE